MTPQNEAPKPPLPCGEGVGGEGRDTAAASQVDTKCPNGRPSSGRSAATFSTGEKVSGGWTPTSAARQKEFVRANGRAKRMRKEMTPSEKKLWTLLREIEGFTFRRQLALGQYVFDFGEYSSRVLIELDGSIHRFADVQENDRAKEVHAVRLGFRVLRFANNDVWDRPHWVVTQVRAFLDAPHPPAPSPPGGGGEER